MELFAVTKMNISLYIVNILNEKKQDDSVVKYYLTTAADGKRYKVIYYAFQLFFRVFDDKSRKKRDGIKKTNICCVGKPKCDIISG